MFLYADLGGREQTVGDGEQPGFPVAMPAPINSNGFEAEIDRGEMGASGDGRLAQDRRGKQPAEPGRMLKHRNLIPGIEGDDRLQHRRQIFGLPQHAAPFLKPRVFVPVEVIDERVSLAAIGRSQARLPGLFDRGVRSGEDRIDGSIVDTGKISGVIIIFPLPFRILCRDLGPSYTSCLGADRAGVRRLSQSSDAIGRERPIGGLAGDPPTSAQHVAGDGEFVGRGAYIAKSVVKDEVFQMDEFAIDLQRGTGIGEILPLEEARADR